MIMMNNENGFSGGDLKEKALSAIITKLIQIGVERMRTTSC